MASDKIEYSRLLIKRSNVSGEIPTVPPVSAVTLNQFTTTDIFVGEFFANVEDETLYFRTNTGIVEIAVSGSTGTTIPSLVQVLNQGNTTGGFDVEVSSGNTITYNGLSSGNTSTFLGLDASGNTITVVAGVGGENLSTTLGIGNTTGTNDIIFTQGYRVEGALGKGYFEAEGSDESISVNYTTTGNTGALNISDTQLTINYSDGVQSSNIQSDGNIIEIGNSGGLIQFVNTGATSGVTIEATTGYPLYIKNLITGTSVNSLSIDVNDRVILAPAAINGTNGTSGTSGAAGSSGTSGAAGEPGASGTSGTSGVSGATGSSGTSGVSGTNGSSGTSGAAGASGTNGTSGTSGTGTTSPYQYDVDSPTSIIPILGSNDINSGSTYSVISGGEGNTASNFGDWNAIAGGRYNTSGDYYSFIGAGTLNTATGFFSVVCGGNDNSATVQGSVVVGGSDNNVSGAEAFIGSGTENTITSQHGVIVGGSYNTSGGQNSSVLGGRENTIEAGSSYSVITGGIRNILKSGSTNSTIVGGSGITGTSADMVYVPNLNIVNATTGTSVSALGIDSTGKVIKATGGGGGDLTIGTTLISGGTVGRVVFQGTGNVIQQDSQLFWDNTNKGLGVGATPDSTVKVDVRADSALSTDLAFRVRDNTNAFNIIEARNNGDVYVGAYAGYQNTGSGNSFFGQVAGFSNTTGVNNSYFGNSAGRSGNVGGARDNSYFGQGAGFSNTAGGSNSFFGRESGYGNLTGGQNSHFGYQAGYNIESGDYNISMGYQAGIFIGTGSTSANTSSDNSVYIGSLTNALSTGQTNQIVIGHQARGIGSNTVALGNSSITKTLLRGDVVLIDPARKFGYDTGAGGTVTQATSKSTGVTLNRPTGQITMNGAALSADTTVTFSLTNSVISAGDILVLQNQETGTLGAYTLGARTDDGSAGISVRNITSGTLSEAMVISFAVIKSVTT